MVDFYWLKSFTEIVQLFISIFFMLYLRKKFIPLTPAVKWLIGFLFFKMLSDLFGVINYTEWIALLLTRPVMSAYRVLMGPIELGMLACFFIFSLFIIKPESAYDHKARHWLYFIPALVLVPINFFLAIALQNSLMEIFLIIRLSFIAISLFLLFQQFSAKFFRIFLWVLLGWNTLWFVEVLLNEALGIINESSSWVLFILAELSITLGIAYFMIQVITQPKILRLEKPDDILPENVVRSIEKQLRVAMHQERLYKDAELNLAKLAEYLNIPANALSLYFNRTLDTNYSQYIASHRIEASKELLATKSRREYTVEQIMYEVGFNSKSVFNTAFKQRTGQTPSAYRKTNFVKESDS